MFECHTPVISAVGHETDYTIIDFVSDMRAPTPSAAAELAVFDYAQWCQRIGNTFDTLDGLIEGRIEELRDRLNSLNLRLKMSAPEKRLLDNRQYLDMLKSRLDMSLDRLMDSKKNRFKLLAARLGGVSPTAKISGGFGYIEGADKNAVRSIDDVKIGENIRVVLSDGSFNAAVFDVNKGAAKNQD